MSSEDIQRKLGVGTAEAMQLQAYLDAKAEEAAGDPDCTTGAPDHCACSHDGRGQLVTECQEHQEIREQRDTLLEELKNIANANPKTWDADMSDQFQQWAQSRARAVIARVEGK